MEATSKLWEKKHLRGVCLQRCLFPTQYGGKDIVWSGVILWEQRPSIFNPKVWRSSEKCCSGGNTPYDIVYLHRDLYIQKLAFKFHVNRTPTVSLSPTVTSTWILTHKPKALISLWTAHERYPNMSNNNINQYHYYNINSMECTHSTIFFKGNFCLFLWKLSYKEITILWLW